VKKRITFSTNIPRALTSSRSRAGSTQTHPRVPLCFYVTYLIRDTTATGFCCLQCGVQFPGFCRLVAYLCRVVSLSCVWTARSLSTGRPVAFDWARVVNPLPLIIYTILGGVKVLVRLSLPTGPWRVRRLVVWLRLLLLVNLNSD
jgi:hypothetical protein